MENFNDFINSKSEPNKQLDTQEEFLLKQQPTKRIQMFIPNDDYVVVKDEYLEPPAETTQQFIERMKLK